VRVDGRNTYVENELSRLGIARTVEVFAPSFIQAPWLLPGTRRIALMHERLARLMAPALGLTIVPSPVASDDARNDAVPCGSGGRRGPRVVADAP
jgi:hypothetical protein